jgi:hypothetical protein
MTQAELGPEPKQPDPPRPEETDAQIRQRHRAELRNRDDSPPPGFDPIYSRDMLRRLSSGNFTLPADSHSESEQE